VSYNCIAVKTPRRIAQCVVQTQQPMYNTTTALQLYINAWILRLVPGTKPTTFEFTVTTPALYIVGQSVFKMEKKQFLF
jgi:hypothetical protein